MSTNQITKQPTKSEVKTQKDLKTLVRKRHRSYTENIEQWKFLRDSYIGGDKFMNAKNLWRYEGEENPDYSRRRELTAYISYVKEIINEKRNLLFSTSATYESINPKKSHELWLEFNKKVSLSGQSRIDFMRRVYVAGSLYGTVFILVDKGRETARDMQEQIDKRIYPYCALYRPMDVLNWSLDRNGKFNYVLLSDGSVDNANPFFIGKPDDIQLYLLYTKDTWFRIEERKTKGTSRFKIIDQDTNALGEVPLVIYRDTDGQEDAVIGDLTLLETAESSRELYNLRSNLNYQIYKTICNMLIILGETVSIEDVKLGSEKIIKIPKDGKVEWLQQEVTGIEEMFNISTENEKAIYRRGKIRGFADKEKLERMSGVAHIHDSSPLFKEMLDDTKALRKIEEEIDRFFGLWENISGFETRITYPNSFHISSAADLIQMLVTSKDVITPTTLAELKILVADALLQSLDLPTRKKIKDEANGFIAPVVGGNPLIPPGTETEQVLSTGVRFS